MARWLPLLAALGCAHRAAEGWGANGDPQLGCDINLSGSWQQEGNAGMRYQATDDGRTLELIPHRVNADGSEVAEDALARQARMELRRSPGLFSGDLHLDEAVGPGETCPLLFRVRLSACASDRVLLEVEQDYALNQACQPLNLGSIAHAEQVLVRVK